MTSTTPTVRAARASDGSTLAAIDVATWSTAVSPAPRPIEGEPFFVPGRSLDDVLVAELDGVVVGYVLLDDGIPIPSADHVMSLRGLAVAPSAQGRGVGRRLIQAAITAVAARGKRRLTSRVLSTNAASLAVHRRCGFEVEGVLRGEFLIDGALVDDVLLARSIDPAVLAGGAR